MSGTHIGIQLYALYFGYYMNYMHMYAYAHIEVYT